MAVSDSHINFIKSYHAYCSNFQRINRHDFVKAISSINVNARFIRVYKKDIYYPQINRSILKLAAIVHLICH